MLMMDNGVHAEASVCISLVYNKRPTLLKIFIHEE